MAGHPDDRELLDRAAGGPADAGSTDAGPGDSDPPRDRRAESPAERLDRNWIELLQEIRVAQTGVQILFAFLLTIPFTQRWEQVTDFQRALYLVTLLLVAAASALLIGPVAYHRMVFRRGARAQLVTAANAMALAGLAMLAMGINSALLLIVDLLMGTLATALICSASVLFFITLWWVLPRLTRPRHRAVGSADGDRDSPVSERSQAHPSIR